MRHILTTILFLTLTINVSAHGNVQFKTPELGRIAEAMNLNKLDTLKGDENIIDVEGRKVIVRKNTLGCISHIGINIIPKDVREQGNLPVYDFIENALLYTAFKIGHNNIKFDDVIFKGGSWSTLLDINPKANISVNIKDKKAYIVSWMLNGKDLVDILIPIKYDLLSNATRKELESVFVRDLQATTLDSNDYNKDIDVANLVDVVDNGDTLYMQKGNSYIQDGITNNTYFKLQADGNYTAFVDGKFPVQSIANAVLAKSPDIPDADAIITILTSDKKNAVVTVPMRQLLKYAESEGCTAYFGYETTKDGVLESSLFLYNELYGYDHIFSLSCKTDDINKGKITFTSRGYLFTPTNNVKNLYIEIKKAK